MSKNHTANRFTTSRLAKYLPSSTKGQTAVFVFILLLIGLTIGLSLSTRTVKDLQSSAGSDLSSRAFAAAEGGVEEALRQDLATISTGEFSAPATFPTDNKTTYSYKVAKTSSFSQTISRDNTVQLRLKNDDGTYFSGSLQIYWLKTTDTVENSAGSRPSLELTFIKNSGGTYTLTKYAVNAEPKSNNFHNPDGSTQAPVTNSLPNYVTGQAGDATYTNLATIAISPSDRYDAIRIRPLYNKGSVAVKGTGLPSSSYVITSQGVAGAAVTRVVQVTRTIPALPAIFDYVLFNGSTTPISK